jgi:hypothetical protein
MISTVFCNAINDLWSSSQTEIQVNPLKILARDARGSQRRATLCSHALSLRI